MIRMESPFLTSGLFNRYKWWPPQRVLESDETALIAADPIPVGTSSQPFSTSLNLRRILDTKPIQTILGVSILTFFMQNELWNVNFTWNPQVHVDRFGLLSVESLHVEWIPLIRLAENCEEQNVEAVIAEKRDAVVLRSTKNIQVGQELKVSSNSLCVIGSFNNQCSTAGLVLHSSPPTPPNPILESIQHYQSWGVQMLKLS